MRLGPDRESHRGSGRSSISAIVRPCVVLAGVLACAVPTATADDLCGATIVANLELDHDLTCAGDGLTVGANGIKVDLNGHTIAGSGSGIGINVSGRTNISIVGGAVQNFFAGVQVRNSAGVVVRESQLVGNTDGVDLQAGSVGNTVKENHFQGNRSRGIMLRGGTSANLVKENTFAGNRVGILLFGAVGSTVKENLVSFSELAGIRLNVLATGNVIKENIVASNPAGIEFVVTPTGSATGNTLRENTITFNACGLKGPVAGNTLTENLFQGNTVDSCP